MFQHRQVARPAPLYSPQSSDRLSTLPLSPSSVAESEDEGVLLFAPSDSDSPPRPLSPVSSSWASLDQSQPFPRPIRTTSYSTQVSTSTGEGTDDLDRGEALPGSPLVSQQSAQGEGESSLLPSHDGNGVFLTTDTDSPASFTSSSHRDLPPYSPSITSSSSLPSSSRHNNSQRAHLRRPSAPSEISFVSSLGSDSTNGTGTGTGTGSSLGWGDLTEENLAASRLFAGNERGRRGQSESLVGSGEFDEAGEEEEEESTGFTSGSEAANEREQVDSPVSLPSLLPPIDSHNSNSNNDDAAEWALSPAALSSGLFPSFRPPPSSRRSLSLSRSQSHSRSRRPPSASLPPLAPTSSVSPSRLSASAKRRHRRAGGRQGSQSSQKKRSSEGRGGVAGRTTAAGLREVTERERGERMRGVVEERMREREREGQGEREKRRVEKAVFGQALLTYFHIPPSSLALLTSPSTSPISSSSPTPVPSRSTSPSRHHGLARLAAQTAQDARFDSFGAGVAEGEEVGEVSDAETEHPGSSLGEEEGGQAGKRWYAVTAPSSPRLRPSSTLDGPLPGRSKSAVELPTLARHTSSGKGKSERRRRAASFSLTSHVTASEGRKLTHEERLILGSPVALPSAVLDDPYTAAGADGAGGEANAWGGDLDSFELALRAWRGLLRRLGMARSGEASAMDDAQEDSGEERLDFNATPIIAAYA